MYKMMIQAFLTFVAMGAIFCEVGQPMPGGRFDVDLKTADKEELEDLIHVAKMGIDSIEEQRASENENKKVDLEFLRLLKAQKQVVAGLNYFFTVRLREANCENDCDVEQCEMTIWQKPWENFTELTEFSCKKYHSLFGSNIRIDEDNEHAHKALDYALDQINCQSNDLYVSKVHSIDKIYRQIVNGMKYTFICKLARTKCTKNSLSSMSLKECPLLENAPLKSVKISVLDRPWNQDKRYELKSTVYY
ncbi:cysteine protease inhibitor [Brachionus plicatilis]|uniref:Cysteine protease inhibitor n=1 Tax=Brachionus plicatilis TaxID=10195 RepID=A0A3M7PYC8_BRAPC|nr:cysteine protease inhibitor [Brachionus plicatilis]